MKALAKEEWLDAELIKRGLNVKIVIMPEFEKKFLWVKFIKERLTDLFMSRESESKIVELAFKHVGPFSKMEILNQWREAGVINSRGLLSRFTAGWYFFIARTSIGEGTSPLGKTSYLRLKKIDRDQYQWKLYGNSV